MFDLEKIQAAVAPAEVVYAHETGSRTYATNPHDEDYVVVVDGWDKEYQYLTIDGADYFIHSRELFLRKCRVEAGSMLDIYAIAQTLGEPVYGEIAMPRYDFMAYIVEAVRAVLVHGEKSYFNPLVVVRNGETGERCCSKAMVWAYMVYYAALNGAPTYTAEQKAVMQQCHDYQLPYANAAILQGDLQRTLGELTQ